MKDDEFSIERGWFGGADCWEGREAAGEVREGDGRGRDGFRERHLQCVWFDGRVRPKGLRDAEGRAVEVVEPGEWNTGAGPDFLKALVRVGEGDGKREVRGDVEVHVRAADWVRHGHGGDPRYAEVRVHVTYGEERLPEGVLPEGCLQVALKPALEAEEGFCFDNLDLTAYPVAARAVPPPCRAAMAALGAERRGAALEAAGEARLRLRAAVLAAAMADKGTGQAVYEETMAALGYRPNRAAFRRLARLVPLSRLREAAGGDAVRAYGVLAGAAGLLPDPTAARKAWDGETRAFARRCWDAWWPLSGEFLPRAMARRDWTFAGVRPPNRPERRLMAAAVLFAPPKGLPEVLEGWAKAGEAVPEEALEAAFGTADAPYWPRRLAWGGRVADEEVALVGASRVREIAANLVVPAMAAMGAPAAVWRRRVRELPAGEANALHRETAARLFGPDGAPELWRSGLRRQGLIHIHHEYCLGDRTRCAACPVPELLKGFAK